MGRRQQKNPRLDRERAVYGYLKALESGDIDGIIESLQQAVYDASLNQMLVDTHQAYLQSEQAQQDTLAESDTRIDLPTLHSFPARGQNNRQKRRNWPRWGRTLVAILIVGVLIGSFSALLVLRQAETHTISPAGTATSTPLTCYPLKQFRTPFSSTVTPGLISVAALSETNAWAVGTSGTNQTLIEHWDGKNWQIVQSPKTAGDTNELTSVAAVSENDIWAVGSRLPHDRPWLRRTLIEHWDGHQWRVIPSPNAGGSSDSSWLNAVAAISTNDVWAVGDYFTTSEKTLIEHWDGKNWSIIPGFDGSMAGTPGSVTDIQAVSSHDIWVTAQGAFEHWDGAHWKSFPFFKGTNFTKMSAISANDIWALGANGNNQSLFARWDGHQWKQVSGLRMPPSFFPSAPPLRTMVAVSDTNVWAAGNITEKGAVVQTVLLMHWDGKTWQQMDTPALQVPSGQASTVTNGMTIYAGRQIWIVGVVSDGNGHAAPLIEGQFTCP